MPRQIIGLVAAGSAVATAAALAIPSAQATVSEGPFVQTVSCDATITDTLKTFTHARSGTLGFRKVSDSDGNFAEVVNARSSTGKWVGAKTVSGYGGLATWSGVAASKYTFTIRPSTSHNCNGAWPGDGNTSLTYRASHE